MWRFFVCVLLLSVLPATARPATHLVLPDGTGDFPTIDTALAAAADGDIVLLGDGVFTGAGNRDIEFRGKAITVRSASGDAAPCVIDCQASGTQRHCGFRFLDGEAFDSVLEAVTIINGYTGEGGAVICYQSSPTIRDCVFRGNWGDIGGGVSCAAASPTIENCLFDSNAAGAGGGLNCFFYSDPVVTGCVFINNAATAAGAIRCYSSSSPAIIGCTMFGNSAVEGGGVACEENSFPTLQNTIIAASLQGEAVFCHNNSTVSLTCCDVFGNAWGDWVGRITDQSGLDGNLHADPLFCDPENGDLHLDMSSPCAAPSAPECGQIGAYGVGCGATPASETTWGALKEAFR